MDMVWRDRFKKLHEQIKESAFESHTVNMAFIDFRSEFNQPPCGIDFSQHDTVKDLIDHYLSEADYIAFLGGLTYLK